MILSKIIVQNKKLKEIPVSNRIFSSNGTEKYQYLYIFTSENNTLIQGTFPSKGLY